MILTVCLSPCIDVNIEVESLSVGMSHKIINKRVFFTGKAINVAIGIARLQEEAFSTGFMYEINGNQFEQELHREGVPYKFIWNKGRVRENYKFIDQKSMLTEVDDISPEVGEESQNKLLELISEVSSTCSAMVVSGGLTRGMTPYYYGKIFASLRKEIIKVVDTEGERLNYALNEGMDLVKPNLGELERTLETKFKDKTDMLNGCYKILDKGAKRVLLSLGKRGAVITDGTKNFYCKSINVAMNSTVGAGDSMVAAATSALVKGAPLEDILKAGVAAGTASVTSPYSIAFLKTKYEEILNALTVKEI